MKQEQRITIYLIIKLFIINVLIGAFGYGVYGLIEDAIHSGHSAGMIAALVPLAMGVIGLMTLEINWIFKWLESKKKKE